jgi:hypothetical protein
MCLNPRRKCKAAGEKACGENALRILGSGSNHTKQKPKGIYGDKNQRCCAAERRILWLWLVG